MAGGKVIIDIGGNPAGAQKAFDKLQQQVVKLQGQLAQLNTTTKRGAAPLQTQNSLLATAGQNILGMVTAYASVHQVIRLVSGEIRAQIETYKRFKEESLTLADIQISAIRNLGAATAEERDKFTGDIAAMSLDLGVSERDLTARAGAVFSARQSLSYEQAMDAVRASAALIPEDAETGKTMAVAAINMEKKTGRGAESNLGLLKAIARTAQVVEWKDIAQNVGPAILAGMQAKMTAEESGAFWASMTHGREDPTGRRSSTAAQKQFEQLVEMFPKEDVYGWKGDPATNEYKRVLETKGTGLESPEDIIQFIRSEYAKGNLMPYERYMAEATFTKGTRVVMRDMLKHGTQIAEGYEFTKGELPKRETSASEFRRDVAVMRGNSLQQTATFGRAVDTYKQQLETADQLGARLAIIREKFVPMLEDVGLGTTKSKLKQALAFTSPDEFREYSSWLKKRQSELEHPGGYAPRKRWKDDPTLGFHRPWVEREPTEAEAKQARVLEKLVAAMDLIAELEAKSLTEQQKTNTKLGNSSANANAAAAAAMEPR